MPKQKPGTSKQDYETPLVFINAVLDRLDQRSFALDVAASALNTKSTVYITETEDALTPGLHWAAHGWSWLNPPYANITPWVRKAWDESRLGAKIAVLVPASVGANWWRDWVHDKAHVLLLNGRVSFDGNAPYPKDLALLLYTPFINGGYEVWNWRPTHGE